MGTLVVLGWFSSTPLPPGRHENIPYVVFGSPVQSSLLAKFGKTITVTSPQISETWKRLDQTDVNWSFVVFYGYKTGLNQFWSKPVTNWLKPVFCQFIHAK